MADLVKYTDPETSLKTQPPFWRALVAALLALYQTVRGYIMPLLIGCLVADLGFLTNAITTIASLNIAQGAHDAHNLQVGGLYSLMGACTIGLVYIVIGMVFWAMRSAFLYQQKQKSKDNPPPIGDQISIFVLEMLCLSFPLGTMFAGLALVRNTNFFLRAYLLLPPVKTHNPLTDFAKWLLRLSWAHPALAGPIAFLIFLIVYILLATARIYVDSRRSSST